MTVHAKWVDVHGEQMVSVKFRGPKGGGPNICIDASEARELRDALQQVLAEIPDNKEHDD